MSLDERLREASGALRSTSIRSRPEIADIVKRRSRNRIVVSVVGTLALIAAGAAVWMIARPDGHHHQLRPVDSSNGALVTPIGFGDGGLVLIPGTWGTEADVTEDDGVLSVSSGRSSATITDIGPATPPPEEHFDPSTSLEDAPRLGPLGPRVDVTTSGDNATVAAVIAGRGVRVEAHGASASAAMNLLRAVTPATTVAVASAGEATMPDVIGADYRDATRQLTALGLHVAWSLDTGNEAAVGAVVASDPAIGANVANNPGVVLTIAAPKPQVGDRSSFLPVSGGEDRIGLPGYLAFDDLGQPRTPAEATEMHPGPRRLPVVFLHGELVALFSQDDPQFEAAIPLDELTDPSYRYQPVPTQGPQATAPPLTKQAEYHGISVEVPDDWRVIENGCPDTKAVLIGGEGARCLPGTPPGPWIALQLAPSQLTPCSLGGIGVPSGELQSCWIHNFDDGVTDQFVLIGTGVMVTNTYASDGGPSVINGIVDTLRAPAAAASTADVDIITNPQDYVQAWIAGTCAASSHLVAPESEVVGACTKVGDGTSTTKEAMGAQSTIDAGDRSRDAVDMTVHDSLGDRRWHVETRHYYDPARGVATALITEVIDPDGVPAVLPTSALTLPPNPVLTVDEIRAGKLVGQRFNWVDNAWYAGAIPQGAVTPGLPTNAIGFADSSIGDRAGRVVDVSLANDYHGAHVLLLAIPDGVVPSTTLQPYRIVDQVVVDLGPTQFMSRQVADTCLLDGHGDSTIFAVVVPGPDYPGGSATTVGAWIADVRSRTFREIDATHVTCPLVTP
jgi:hypothetical protein